MNAAYGPRDTQWRKSNYSNGMENCVEVASDRPQVIPAQDGNAAPAFKTER